MSYSLRRYHEGQGTRLARFVLPIATRTYAQWTDAGSAALWAHCEHGAAAWEARLAENSTHVLAFERPDTSVAACAFARISDARAYFGGLYVEDVGCGLGTRLLDARLRLGREAGARTAVMLIRETNQRARLLAERAGFEVVDRDPCTRLSTVPRLVYERSLIASVPAIA